MRADASTLADLLVDDVSKDSGSFRNRVATALEALTAEGVLMKVAQEYRLQTTAGAAWERDFRSQQIALARKEVEVAAHRERLLSTAVQEIVSRIRLPHGEAKQRRKLALHTNTDPDAGDGDAVRVWLRDEWSCSWKEVLGEARGRGMEDPVLHVYLPKRSADQLKKHIVDTEASIAAWKRLAERARKRSPVWELATALSRHAIGELGVAEEVAGQLDAIRSQRSLLDEADHVSPCVAKLAAELRSVLAERHDELTRAVTEAAAHLDGDATWSRLDETTRERIRRAVGLTLPQPLQVQTNEALGKALDARSLSAWQSGIDAVPGWAGKAMTEAVRHLPPDDPPGHDSRCPSRNAG